MSTTETPPPTLGGDTTEGDTLMIPSSGLFEEAKATSSSPFLFSSPSNLSGSAAIYQGREADVASNLLGGLDFGRTPNEVRKVGSSKEERERIFFDRRQS